MVELDLILKCRLRAFSHYPDFLYFAVVLLSEKEARMDLDTLSSPPMPGARFMTLLLPLPGTALPVERQCLGTSLLGFMAQTGAAETNPHHRLL